MNKQLIVSLNGGVSSIHFESITVLPILSAQFLPKYLAAAKDGFLLLQNIVYISGRQVV